MGRAAVSAPTISIVSDYATAGVSCQGKSEVSAHVFVASINRSDVWAWRVSITRKSAGMNFSIHRRARLPLISASK